MTHTIECTNWTTVVPWRILGLIMGQDYTKHGDRKAALSGAGFVEALKVVSTFVEYHSSHPESSLITCVSYALSQSTVLRNMLHDAEETVM